MNSASDQQLLRDYAEAHSEAALGELNEGDRDAVLLRYFERKSAREMAGLLGISDDAAQKRVSRAVERLREFCAKRGVTVGAGGLVVAISANAVQAAPIGLVATVSATALAATTLAATATKAIAMTTLQKALITASIAAALSTGVYEAHQASTLRHQNQMLRQQQAPLAEQIQQFSRALTEATNQVAALRADNERLNRNTAELLKLRGEAARLRQDSEELASLKSLNASDSSVTAVNAWLDRVERLKQRLQQTPGASIPELQSVTQEDWLTAAQADLKTDADFRRAFSRLRFSAENKYVQRMVPAVKKYAEENAAQLPADLLQLKSSFNPPVEDAILRRYEIVPAASLPTLTLRELDGWVITQKAPVDLEYDSRLAAGPAMWGSGSFEQSEMVKTLTPALRAYAQANNGNLPTDPSQLAAYVTTPEEQAALQKGARMYEAESPEQRALDAKMLQRLRLK